MTNVITRPDPTGMKWELWERRKASLESPHFTVQHLDGHLGLHTNPRCSKMILPFKIGVDVVDSLWEAEHHSTQVREHGVDWCEKCTVRRVTS